VVGEPDEIELVELEWDQVNQTHIAEHGVTAREIEEVRNVAPKFYRNLPDRGGTHVMIGPDSNGRFYYVVLAASSKAGHWRVITAYRYTRRRALRLYGG
jgi:hypothetical protein